MVAMAVCSERECGYFKPTLPTISLFKFNTLLPAANEYTLYPGRCAFAGLNELKQNVWVDLRMMTEGNKTLHILLFKKLT